MQIRLQRLFWQFQIVKKFDNAKKCIYCALIMMYLPSFERGNNGSEHKEAY